MGKERSMNLKQLTYFVALAKNQNFTTAANELFICQSALSKTIKAMEEDALSGRQRCTGEHQ